MGKSPVPCITSTSILMAKAHFHGYTIASKRAWEM